MKKVKVVDEEIAQVGGEKMYKVIITAHDLTPDITKGLVEFICNDKVCSLPHGKEIEITQAELNCLNGAVAIDHYRTEGPDGHAIITMQERKRYTVQVLGERTMKRGLEHVMTLTEVKSVETSPEG